MPIETLVPLVVSIVAIGVAVYSSIHKTPAEVRGMDSSTAGKWQEIADRAAEKALKLEERITGAEATIKALQAKVASQNEENEDLRDWAERLVAQVKTLGMEPVKIRQRRIGSHKPAEATS